MYVYVPRRTEQGSFASVRTKVRIGSHQGSLQDSHLPIPFFLWTLGYEFESSNLAFVAKCLLM